MIGQQKLKNKLDTYTLSTLPHSILLVGDRGSEQQEICKYISDKFDLPLYGITELISEEYINEIYSMPNFGLYIIDGMKITEREQNVLLKFYEEPNNYTYIIIWCETDANMLETIRTRSYELEMDKYTREQLEPLCTQELKDLALSIANTPGAVEEVNHIKLMSLKTLCEAVIDNMSKANYSNALSIANQINFKDEYDKYPLWAFIRMLGRTVLDYLSEGKKVSKKLYFILEDFDKKYLPLLDKKRYFENMITKMWLEARNGH